MIQVLVVLLLFQLLVYVFGKAVEDGPSTWVHVNMWETQRKQAPGFQHWTGPAPTAAAIWGVEHQMRDLFFSPSVIISNKYSKKNSCLLKYDRLQDVS